MKNTIYNLKGVINATLNQTFPCELKRMSVWICSRNPINGNTSCAKWRWVFINIETGENHFPPSHSGKYTENNTFITKKRALAELKRRGDV